MLLLFPTPLPPFTRTTQTADPAPAVPLLWLHFFSLLCFRMATAEVALPPLHRSSSLSLFLALSVAVIAPRCLSKSKTRPRPGNPLPSLRPSAAAQGEELERGAAFVSGAGVPVG